MQIGERFGSNRKHVQPDHGHAVSVFELVRSRHIVETASQATNAIPRDAAQFVYSVGGVTLRVRVADPRLAPEIARARTAFAVAEHAPDIDVDVCWVDDLALNVGDQVFDSGECWKLFRLGDALTFEFISPAAGREPYRTMCVTDEFAQATVSLKAALRDQGRVFDPLEFPIEEILVSNYLARGRGILVHACGIVDSAGRGHLFLGHSGDGKTTLSRLWAATPGVHILSDDRIIVRLDERGYRMYGTPWHGEAEYASAASAPVSFVYFIEHGDRNHLTPQAPAAAAARLFARGFPPFFDAAAVGFILDFQGALASLVPCATFAFVPDLSATRFVLRESEPPQKGE